MQLSESSLREKMFQNASNSEAFCKYQTRCIHKTKKVALVRVFRETQEKLMTALGGSKHCGDVIYG